MRRDIKRAKQAQMPAFGWVFAIIIGIVILFLVMYFVGKMISTQGYGSDVELARSFDILLNPFASISGLGPISMGKTIKLPQETIIEFSCYYNKDELGSQGLSLKSKSNFGKWGEFTKEMYIYDKYIYAENLQGKNFYVLSKSFELPFRIDDLIYIISDDYCFVNAPAEIKEQFENMNIQKIKFDDCAGKRVCFGSIADDCDINIIGEECEGYFCDNIYEYGVVGKIGKDRKDKEFTFITDALMYAAVFSDEETYGCNLNRLMYRLVLLSEIYEKKAKMLDNECNVQRTIDAINKLKDRAEKGDAIEIITSSQELDDTNTEANCQVF